MTEMIDYVLVEQALTVNPEKFTENIRCVFIGTKNYLFAVPFKIVDFQMNYNSNTTETTDMYYEGMPLQEFIVKKAKEPNLKVDDFESFIISLNSEGLKVKNLNSEVKQLKTQANFFGSAVIINETERKVGWKPFVLKFKKDKERVKKFYENHPKIYRKK